MVAKTPGENIKAQESVAKDNKLSFSPVENTQEAKENLTEDVLEKISNKEFLRIHRDKRLENITKPTKKSSELKEGDSITFTFSFNGKRNADLYLKTTAGQVLPETVNSVQSLGQTWTRNGLLGEFFDKNGNRLIIRDSTTLTIPKPLSGEEIKQKEEKILESIKEFTTDINYALIVAAAKRNIDPKLAIALFSDKINSESPDQRGIAIEEEITEFERTKDYFHDDYRKNSTGTDGAISKEFLAYYLNDKKSLPGKNIDKIRGDFGIDENTLNSFSRKERAKAFAGFKKMEELTPDEKASLADIPNSTLTSWKEESFGKTFIPGSKEAQQLFTYAAIVAGIPKEWGTNEKLHYVLGRESAGVVGRVNYTLKNANINGEGLKNIALKNEASEGKNIAGIVGVSSTAVGLGQLTLSNEKYLPNGRKSIGIPLEEAIGMLRYIKDRYGSIEVAGEMYGKIGYYTHADTGRQMPKDFKEGY